MGRRSCATSVFAVLLAALSAGAQIPPPGQTAGQHYKNVQVLKDIPDEELIPAMDFITGALGVECSFCHVREGAFPQGFEKDDKKNKQTAREMMRMMRQINDASFSGRTEVTCASCHNGHARPQSYPPILTAEAAAQRVPPAEATAADAKLPPATDLFARWEQAIGGDAAIAKITSRHVVVRIAAAAGGATIEAYYRAPDLFLQEAGGRSVAFNGTLAWRSTPQGPEVLNGMDADDIHLAGLFYRNLRPSEVYSEAQTVGTDKISGKDAYVVRAAVNGGRYTDLLYFDPATGLLLRRTTLARTALGPSVQSTDFDNYQEVNGVKWAMDTTVSNSLGAPRKLHFDKVEFNVPVEAGRFAMPAVSARK